MACNDDVRVSINGQLHGSAAVACSELFGEAMLAQSQISQANPDELTVTVGLPLGSECSRKTPQTRETPRRPNSTEGNEGNKDGTALRGLRCLLFKTCECNALCAPPNSNNRTK